MVWFKVDDSFYDHPKVFDAPDCAVALWTRAGAWSARNLTDGFVPSNLPQRLSDDPTRAAAELVRRGLWSKTSGGYQFHDWPDYQPRREEVQDARKRHAQAQARYRKKKRDGPGDGGVIDHQTISDRAPTRPDPLPLTGKGRGRTPRKARGAAPPPDADAPLCPTHGLGHLAANCGPCRSEAIAAQ